MTNYKGDKTQKKKEIRKESKTTTPNRETYET